jgi:hypothetical protein
MEEPPELPKFPLDFHQKTMLTGLTPDAVGDTLRPDTGFGHLYQPAGSPLGSELRLEKDARAPVFHQN